MKKCEICGAERSSEVCGVCGFHHRVVIDPESAKHYAAEMQLARKRRQEQQDAQKRIAELEAKLARQAEQDRAEQRRKAEAERRRKAEEARRIAELEACSSLEASSSPESYERGGFFASPQEERLPLSVLLCAYAMFVASCLWLICPHQVVIDFGTRMGNPPVSPGAREYFLGGTVLFMGLSGLAILLGKDGRQGKTKKEILSFAVVMLAACKFGIYVFKGWIFVGGK